jgi:glutaminyl-tRNA synthetase
MEDPPRKFFRLGPGREVRLRYAFFITCNEVIKNADGEVTELQCTYDPLTRGGDAPDGRKVKGTIHWVSVEHARTAEVRLYNPLYNRSDPGAEGDFVDDISTESLEVLRGCKLEPSLDQAPAGIPIQFERTGYFVTDPDGTLDAPVYNRTVALRDSWAKAKAKG